jgi:hypothetical protein
VRTSLRGTRIWLSALALIAVPAQAIASCDISGSSVMFQGIEKRDGTLAKTQPQTPAPQGSTQSKPRPQATSPATASKPPR